MQMLGLNGGISQSVMVNSGHCCNVVKLLYRITTKDPIHFSFTGIIFVWQTNK